MKPERIVTTKEPLELIEDQRKYRVCRRSICEECGYINECHRTQSNPDANGLLIEQDDEYTNELISYLCEEEAL